MTDRDNRHLSFRPGRSLRRFLLLAPGPSRVPVRSLASGTHSWPRADHPLVVTAETMADPDIFPPDRTAEDHSVPGRVIRARRLSVVAERNGNRLRHFGLSVSRKRFESCAALGDQPRWASGKYGESSRDDQCSTELRSRDALWAGCSEETYEASSGRGGWAQRTLRKPLKSP